MRLAPPSTRRSVLQAGSALALALAAGWARQASAQSGLAAPAVVSPPELAAELPGAALRGTGTLRFLGLHIYDIRLWSPAPPAADTSGQPLALELIYARSLVGEQIASRSITEMKRIGTFSEAQQAQWLAAMTRLFPDVTTGDRLTGVQRPGQAARFHLNGQYRGEVADADFARLFFGIWLSPRTSEPKLRARLLGGAP